MKKAYLALILSVFAVSSAAESDIGKALGKADVSHLELLANNMNILTMISKIHEGNEKKGRTKDNDMENTLTKYSTSKDYRFVIQDFYTAPVTKVTNKVCNEQLIKLADQISGKDSKLSTVMAMLSPTKLSSDQAQDVLNNAHLIVSLQAKENSQLSISCQK